MGSERATDDLVRRGGPTHAGGARLRVRAATYPFTRLTKMLVSTWDRRLDLALDISRHGDVVRLPVPGKPVYFVTHPDDIHRVLVSERDRFVKSVHYAILRQYMGDGLVTMEGERWQADRKRLQPFFTKAGVEPSRDLMQAEITRLGDRWENAREPIDLFADLLTLTLTVMGRHLLGADLSQNAERIRHAIDFCARHATTRAQSVIDWARWIRTSNERHAVKAKDEVRAILASGLRNGSAVLHVLDGRPEAEIVDHLLNLFAAGYDTTGNAMGFCLVELAKDPELQTRVRSAIGDERYVAALVQETVRFYPTVPGLGRTCVNGAAWDGVQIEAGATVFVFLYGLHHRADLWPDPERFWPERFLPENRASVNHDAYLPFGSGPRVCVGAGFATQELMLGLAHFIARFRFELVGEPPTAVPGISLRPTKPVLVRARRG